MVDEIDTYGDNGHTMQMTADMHMVGKEGELWQYINSSERKEHKGLDIPLSHFPE
jgi:hypothetical protein